MKGFKTDLIGYNVMNQHELSEIVNEAGEVVKLLEKRVVTGSKKMPLSPDKKIDTFFSVSLVGNEFVVQVNVPTVPNMTGDELQAHGLIVQQIQAKGNEVKADLEATK